MDETQIALGFAFIIIISLYIAIFIKTYDPMVKIFVVLAGLYCITRIIRNYFIIKNL